MALASILAKHDYTADVNLVLLLNDGHNQWYANEDGIGRDLRYTGRSSGEMDEQTVG